MLGLSTRAVKTLLAFLLLLTILLPIGAQNAHASPVSVSPGRSDLNLGAGFPTFSPVKLSYPNSSILTNSRGDLLFTVTPNSSWVDTFRATSATEYTTTAIDIYIPPDFSGISIGQLWTSFTNNYNHNSLSVSRLSSSDQFGPNWWDISVQNLTISDPVSSMPPAFNFPTHAALRIFQINRAQYVRLFQVTSPSTAGRYFFKVFLTKITTTFTTVVVNHSSGPVSTLVSVSGSGFNYADTACTISSTPNIVTLSSCAISSGTVTASFTVSASAALGAHTIQVTGTPTNDFGTVPFDVTTLLLGNSGSNTIKSTTSVKTSIGAEIFPTLVVKASKDPAYISGTLRNSGYHDPLRAGQPIILPTGTGAQVVATGFDYLGRPVSAQAFINSTITRCCNATGYPFLVPSGASYTLFGVAPGTYNITVYAAGFVPAINGATEVSVAAAQSLEGVDIYMTESVNVAGTVLSETANGGLIPWGTLSGFGGRGSPRAISIKLLSLDGRVVVASTPYPYEVSLTTTPTLSNFTFSIQHYVGWDGRIPQDSATYTSGLSWGDYLLQAFVTNYVQLDEVYVHVANETTRTVSVIRLIRTGFFNVTVHFRDYNSSIVDDPIPAGYGGTLTVSAYDQQGILRAQNVTSVPPGTNSTAVELGGFSNSRSFGIASLFSANYGLLPGTYHIKTTFTSSPSFAGYANVGIRNLYYQLWDVEATIGFPTYKEVLLPDGPPVEIVLPVAIGLPMFKGGGILLTLRSIDDQLPPLDYPWAYPGANIQIQILDPYGNVYNSNATQLNNATLITPPPLCGGPINSTNPSNSACVNGTFTLFYSGLLSNDYVVVIRTLGYTQSQILKLHVVLGGNSDATIWMILNPAIDLTVAFKDEGLLSIIDSTQPYAQPINNLDATPARAEVFDDLGNFVAADQTYVSNNSTDLRPLNTGEPTRIAHFILAGFNSETNPGQYYGDPRYVWSGFYDTTDGVSQSAGGLFLYPWENNETRTFTVRLWVDGYYQYEQWHVIVPARDENWNGRRLGPAVISIVESLNRASRISGTVIGPDFFDRARPLSWATITLQPDNYSLSGIIDVQPGNYTTSSLDGSFQLWAPEGTYGMGVSLEGYVTYSVKLAVSPGSDTNEQVWLESF